MADEHMSNGEAAAWPTTGMIFSVAEVSRHGSAATAQPPRGSSAAPSVNHATTRMKRRRILEVDTWASVRQAVVLTWCPTSPAGSDGCGWLPDSRVGAVAPGLLAAAGLSAGGVGAREEKRVEERLLGTVMMSLAWRLVSISRRLPWAQGVRLFSACGATYCTTNHRAVHVMPMHEGKRAFRRFLRPVPMRCDPFQIGANAFFGGMLAWRNPFGTARARRQRGAR